MPMQEAQYERKKATIKDLSTGESKTHTIQTKDGDVPSINAAKRASRALQGTLGNGVLRVVK